VLSKTISGGGDTKITEEIKSVGFVSGAGQCHGHKMDATTNNLFFSKKWRPEEARNVHCNVWLPSFERRPNRNIMCGSRPGPVPVQTGLGGPKRPRVVVFRQSRRWKEYVKKYLHAMQMRRERIGGPVILGPHSKTEGSYWPVFLTRRRYNVHRASCALSFPFVRPFAPASSIRSRSLRLPDQNSVFNSAVRSTCSAHFIFIWSS
jgi:hypothetical protein